MSIPKLVLVTSARPNFMKLAPLAHALNAVSSDISYQIVHTGQHYDPAMSQSFFDQLNIPKPHVNLEIGSGTHAEQTAKVMMAFDLYLTQEKPDMVIVFGDVNPTMACAITAVKQGILVAHVEAGLRSFDRQMPEEINRLITDAISDVLYTPSQDADVHLRKEGVAEDKIVPVGNIMIDTLKANLEKAKATQYGASLGVTPKKYVLMTLHRPSNVDDPETLALLIEVVTTISHDYPVIWPIHPRTHQRLQSFGLATHMNTQQLPHPGLYCVEPLGYLENLNLLSEAALVLTDSGGLQEESTALNVPCITVRDNTERPVTVTHGTNILAGSSKQGVLEAYRSFKASPKRVQTPIPMWDGKTAVRIVEDILKRLKTRGN